MSTRQQLDSPTVATVGESSCCLVDIGNFIFFRNYTENNWRDSLEKTRNTKRDNDTSAGKNRLPTCMDCNKTN